MVKMGIIIEMDKMVKCHFYKKKSSPGWVSGIMVGEWDYGGWMGGSVCVDGRTV